MTEATKTTSKTTSKKNKTRNMYLLAGGGAIVVYLLYRHFSGSSSSAASSAPASGAIDPLTGNPYQAGVGSLASGALGGSSGIDPLTGQPYGSSTSSSGIDPTTGQSYSSEIASLESQVLGGGQSSTQPSTTTTTNNYYPPAGSSTVPPAPTAPTVPGTRNLIQWSQAAYEQLVKAKVAPGTAQQAINQYLNGGAISSPQAAHALANVTSSGNALGAPPVAIVPTVRVAKQTPLIKGPTTKAGTLVHGL